jgi:hypothetical protein
VLIDPSVNFIGSCFQQSARIFDAAHFFDSAGYIIVHVGNAEMPGSGTWLNVIFPLVLLKDLEHGFVI